MKLSRLTHGRGRGKVRRPAGGAPPAGEAGHGRGGGEPELSYTGSLLGPAAIGWLAQGVGLTWSLSSVLLVLAAVGWFATWTSHALPARQEDQPPMAARARGGRD